MEFTYIIFWNKEEKPLKITKKEYDAIMKIWHEADHLVIRGEIIHKKAIMRIKKPQAPEPIGIEAPKEKPVSKDFLEMMKAKIAQKFTP